MDIDNRTSKSHAQLYRGDIFSINESYFIVISDGIKITMANLHTGVIPYGAPHCDSVDELSKSIRGGWSKDTIKVYSTDQYRLVLEDK